MQIDIVQGSLQIDQCLFGLSRIIIECRNGTISARNLIPVTITLKQAQRIFGKDQRQTVYRQVIRIDQAEHTRPLLAQQQTVATEHQQLSHSLKRIGLKISISPELGHLQTLHQITKFSDGHFFTRRCLVHTTRPAHIRIIQPLGRVIFQSLFRHSIDSLHGLLILLQIIIINSRNDIKLRKCIIQPTFQPVFFKRRTILIKTPDALQCTIMIIIELLVHGSTLTDLHHPHIGHQSLNLVVAGFRRLSEQTGCMLEIHPHECTKAHVVQCLRPARRISFRQRPGFCSRPG